MPIRLNGSTSGYVELAAPAVAGTTVLTLPTDSIQPGAILVASQSFSAVSTVNVNNCFTTTYDRYLVCMDNATASTALSVTIKMRGGGTTTTDSLYFAGAIAQSQIAAGTYLANSLTGLEFAQWANGTDTYTASAWTIVHPALVRQTSFLIHSISGASGAIRAVVGGGVHSTVAAYDGFALSTSTGTISGNIRVYGYRD